MLSNLHFESQFRFFAQKFLKTLFVRQQKISGSKYVSTMITGLKLKFFCQTFWPNTSHSFSVLRNYKLSPNLAALEYISKTAKIKQKNIFFFNAR